MSSGLRNFVRLVVLVCVIFLQTEVLSLWSISANSRRHGFFLRSINTLSSVSADSSSPGITDVGRERIDISRDKDEHYMRLALRHAQHAFREKEVPIGAVIVDADGVILATSRNQVEAKNDVTAHAEISCIRKAAQIKKNWRLSDCTLYSTLEPCPMCMGAIQASRITKVVYGAPDIRMGACGSWVNLVESKHPFHDVLVVGGLLREESSTLMKRFFQMRRREASEGAIKDSSGDDDGDALGAADTTAALSCDGADEVEDDDALNSVIVSGDSNVDGDRGDSTSIWHPDRGFHFNKLLDLDL